MTGHRMVYFSTPRLEPGDLFSDWRDGLSRKAFEAMFLGGWTSPRVSIEAEAALLWIDSYPRPSGRQSGLTSWMSLWPAVGLGELAKLGFIEPNASVCGPPMRLTKAGRHHLERIRM